MMSSRDDLTTTDDAPRTLPERLSRALPPRAPEQIIDDLISAPDYERQIQAVDPQALYNLIREAGWDQGYDLVPYVSPQQFQIFVDLDCWREDKLVPELMYRWLGVVIDEADDAKFRRVCRELDAEVLAILFKKNLHVELTEEGRIPDHLEGHVAPSPDNVYAIVYPEDEDMARMLRSLLDRLYDTDMVLAWTLLEAVRWELVSPLEEEARRWRMSRLEEYGFLPREEALEVYALLDPERQRQRLEDEELTSKRSTGAPENLDLPTVITEELEGDFYILAMIDRLEDDASVQERIFELTALLNKAMIADGIEPGEPGSGREVVRRTLGYASLGLEFLARGDDERGVTLLETTPLRRIFRTGYSLAHKLQSKVRALRNRPALSIVTGEPFSLLTPDQEALFDALTRPRPTWAADRYTYDLLRSQEQFDDAALRISMVALEQLWLFGIQQHTVASLAAMVYGDPESGAEPVVDNEPIAITFDSLFATYLGNFLVDGAASFASFDRARLEALAAAVSERPWGDDPVGHFEEVVGDFLVALPAGATRLVTRWLEETLARLVDELGAVRAVETAEIFEELLLVEESDEAAR
jgi:hypothetical protein